MWKASWGLSHHGDNPITSKIIFDNIKEVFPAKEWDSFHPVRKKLDHSFHLKHFLKYECELYSKELLRPPQHKIIVNYRTSNHRPALESRRWSTIPIFGDNRLCHFCTCNVVLDKAHFVLEYPSYNPIIGKFQSLFEKVGLRSL